MNHLPWRIVLRILFGWSAMLMLAPKLPPQDVRCFPQTGHCISGPFRQFWEQNGGLATFGYPISSVLEPLKQPIDAHTAYLVQFFERQRFELHPENAPPYRVQLGLLGDPRLRALGRVWFTFPKADSRTANYFALTGHAIAPEFSDYWHTHGLELGDTGVSYRESLALFGAPISSAAHETINGQTLLVQWFEHARFELHPENAPPYTVLLGRLGDEIYGMPIDYEFDGVVASVSPSDRTITLTEPVLNITTIIVTDRSRISFAAGRLATLREVRPQQRLTIGGQSGANGSLVAVYIRLHGEA